MDSHKQAELDKLLLLALKAEGAEMGVIRNYEHNDDELVIVSHHGFSPEYLSHFHSVKPFDKSSCGRAFGIGSTILINDIDHDLSFKKQVKLIRLLNADFRAVKSVPIVTARGRKLGVLSSHFKEPKWNWHFKFDDEILAGIVDLLY